MSASTLLETAAVSQAAVAAAPAAPKPAAKEWLTFRPGEEEYGIDILHVQEIRSCEKPTRIANMPGHMKGVLNLRGVIVPILDLRTRFALTDPRYDGDTDTVVLSMGGRVVGAVVDAVCDVIALTADDVQPAPAMKSSVEPGLITGIGSLTQDGRERMLILLDLGSLISNMGEQGLVMSPD